MHSLTRVVLAIAGTAVASAVASAPAMASQPANDVPEGTELVVEHAVAHIPVDLTTTVDRLLGPGALDPAHVQVMLGEPTVEQQQDRDQPLHKTRQCGEGLAWDKNHLTCTYAGLVQGQSKR